jgi:integrase
MNVMNQRFILFRRHGTYYCQDTETRQQLSLRTKDEAEARTLLQARNESFRQPHLNLQLARTYLAASDPSVATRTWQDVMSEIPKLKSGSTRVRWECAIKAGDLDSLRSLPLLQTRAEHFLEVLEDCGVSTNSYLRRIHCFALDMNWLPWPVLPKKRWPALKFKQKRAITRDEHQKILAAESNPEWRAFYELLWHLGGSQTDIATLRAENVDLAKKTVSYSRRKTGSLCFIHFGESVAEILRSRPQSGFLFPMIALWKQADRGKAFIRRCRLAKVSGVSLHSYRYAWAQRARQAGYPFSRLGSGRGTPIRSQSSAKNSWLLARSDGVACDHREMNVFAASTDIPGILKFALQTLKSKIVPRRETPAVAAKEVDLREVGEENGLPPRILIIAMAPRWSNHPLQTLLRELVRLHIHILCRQPSARLWPIP